MTDTEDEISSESDTSPASAPARTALGRDPQFRRIAIGLCVVAVLGVYMRSAWAYNKSVDPYRGQTSILGADFHNLIADGILAGKVTLDLDAPRGLVHLKNPYDPVANQKFRGEGYHDLTLYKGKLYAYFGPTPALLLFVPFRALGVGNLNETLAALIFVAVGFLFAVATFRVLARRFFGELPLLIDCLAVLAIGLAVPAPFIIYIGRGYEVSIAGAYCFLFIGLFCLARGLFTEPSPKPLSLALGSLWVGFSFGARYNLVFAALFLAAAAVWIYRSVEAPDRRRNAIIAVLAPFAGFGLAIALFNYARFGAFTEFGSSYQLIGADVHKYPFAEPGFLPRGLYFYLLAPPRFGTNFPYLYLLEETFTSADVRHAHEPVVGTLSAMPVITMGILLGLSRARTLFRESRTLVIVAVLLGTVAFLAIAAPAYQIPGATMRYGLDYAPMLMIGSLLAWLAWRRKATGRLQRVGDSLWFVALLFSVAFNLAITAIPCAGTGSC